MKEFTRHRANGNAVWRFDGDSVLLLIDSTIPARGIEDLVGMEDCLISCALLPRRIHLSIDSLQ